MPVKHHSSKKPIETVVLIIWLVEVAKSARARKPYSQWLENSAELASWH